MSNFLDGYIDVAERIRQLKAKYPDAVLRPYNPAEPFKIMEIGGREFIVYTAACYRTPDDPMPAIAVAAELSVGKTPYTKESEVMNAETSAWGRCIVAALAADTQKIASLEEVRNRRAEEALPSIQEHPAGSARPKLAPAANAPEPVAPRATPTPSGKPEVLLSAAQLGLVEKLCREKANGTPAAEFVKHIIQREISTVNELTKREATAAINHLMNLPSGQA